MPEKPIVIPIEDRIKALFGPIAKLRKDPYGMPPKYMVDEESFDEQSGYFRLNSLISPLDDLEYVLLDRENKIVAHREINYVRSKTASRQSMIEYTDGAVVGRYIVHYASGEIQSVLVGMSPMAGDALPSIELHAAGVIYLDDEASSVGIGYGDTPRDWQKEAVFNLSSSGITFQFSSSSPHSLPPRDVILDQAFFPPETHPYGYVVKDKNNLYHFTRIDTANRYDWHLTVQKSQNLHELESQMRSDRTQWPNTYQTLQVSLLMTANQPLLT